MQLPFRPYSKKSSPQSTNKNGIFPEFFRSKFSFVCVTFEMCEYEKHFIPSNVVALKLTQILKILHSTKRKKKSIADLVTPWDE